MIEKNLMMKLVYQIDMEKHKPWRELFSQEVKVDLGSLLRATIKNGKLKLKILLVVIDQTMVRGRLSLIGKVQGAQLNIDNVKIWEKI